MRNIALLLLTLLFGATAHASPAFRFDLKRLANELAVLRAQEVLPEITSRDPGLKRGIRASFTAARGFERVSTQVIEEFQKIGLSVFGRSGVFRLGVCKEPCIFELAATDIMNREVLVSVPFIEYLEDHFKSRDQDQRDAIRFVLAHEISHYLLEAMAQSSPTGRTPHGRVRLSLEEEPAQFELSHSEVDALATVIVREMGSSPDIGARVAEATLALHESSPSASPEALRSLRKSYLGRAALIRKSLR